MTGRLRIVAGEQGGRLIACPDAIARPTTDRVREAMFSSLASILGSFEGLAVCDAFAGSGALGFEALSRGAASAQFFDSDPKAVRCVSGNAADLGVEGRAHITSSDVLRRGIGAPSAPYDLVFLDPPYATEMVCVASLLSQAADAGLLGEGCIITYERSSAAPCLDLPEGFQLVKQKRYGKTAVDVLQWEGDPRA